MTNDELIEKWIELNPHKQRREEAVIRDTLVPVWSVVGYSEAYHGDLARVAEGFDIPLEAVEAAMAYYAANKCVIDNRIEANAI
ncbi:MAG TPA: DUF433 domain-containing protein [Dehalococcoidia bacterium]|nr:DUF433 domain-containing protein [Dehalococcoidia bacterium]